ncbi:hypothetical protein LY90DRAFT_196321 [Neocallimastix californiae]|uniref:Uncharacterized protein n=1 Tax=Neocallimastix californiae TaxID=1754190 RepID=A0A1Y1ZIL1_9FUNG|nr:hypothetical protein LY90DRAFT_196321 [Neocallimastix californiae]|eukprot:ORY10093.1 hypothetical protein LY90DRAFT_196321 [Neocallimastix californiae]
MKIGKLSKKFKNKNKIKNKKRNDERSIEKYKKVDNKVINKIKNLKESLQKLSKSNLLNNVENDNLNININNNSEKKLNNASSPKLQSKATNVKFTEGIESEIKIKENVINISNEKSYLSKNDKHTEANIINKTSLDKNEDIVNNNKNININGNINVSISKIFDEKKEKKSISENEKIFDEGNIL